jgi:hypothetical protein
MLPLFCAQKYHPRKFLDMGKNDTGLGSILSPSKNWFHQHWSHVREKNPPDIS